MVLLGHYNQDFYDVFYIHDSFIHESWKVEMSEKDDLRELSE